MTQKSTVALIGFLDTKAAEHALVRETLEKAGCAVIMIDISIKEHPETPKIAIEHSAEAVCAAASTSVSNIRSQSRYHALQVMIKGVTNIVLAYQDQRVLHGVMGMGGSTSTAVVSDIMGAINIGLPKLIVSTMASGNVSTYVGDSDITIMPSIVDVSGRLNPVSSRILSNAAAAMAGMAHVYRPSSLPTNRSPSAPSAFHQLKRIAITMFGLTTPAVNHVMEQLATFTDSHGVPLYEPVVFHATGSGGRSMERLINEGWFDGVIDLTTTELADNLAGGVLSAGPERLMAAIRKGIPLVISLGALDMVNFGAPDSIPEKYDYKGSTSLLIQSKGLEGEATSVCKPRRVFHEHNSSVTVMRTSVDECRMLGREIAEKILTTSVTRGIHVVLPRGGFSGIDKPGGVFWDPEADESLISEFLQVLSSRTDSARKVMTHTMKNNINDKIVGVKMVALLHEMFQ